MEEKQTVAAPPNPIRRRRCRRRYHRRCCCFRRCPSWRSWAHPGGRPWSRLQSRPSLSSLSLHRGQPSSDLPGQRINQGYHHNISNFGYWMPSTQTQSNIDPFSLFDIWDPFSMIHNCIDVITHIPLANLTHEVLSSTTATWFRRCKYWDNALLSTPWIGIVTQLN